MSQKLLQKTAETASASLTLLLAMNAIMDIAKIGLVKFKRILLSLVEEIGLKLCVKH